MSLSLRFFWLRSAIRWLFWGTFCATHTHTHSIEFDRVGSLCLIFFFCRFSIIAHSLIFLWFMIILIELLRRQLFLIEEKNGGRNGCMEKEEERTDVQQAPILRRRAVGRRLCELVRFWRMWRIVWLTAASLLAMAPRVVGLAMRGRMFLEEMDG